MGKIFLFTKGAKIGNETRKRLREAGIVPVEVESLDCVRLLDATTAEVDAAIILRAAMRAINISPTAQAALGKELAVTLGKDPDTAS